MLLAVDIGNTHIVAGIYVKKSLKASWRFASRRSKSADEYQILLRDFLKSARLVPSRIRGAIISSVVPSLLPVFQEVLQRLISRRPLVVGPELDLGIRIATRYPEEVGADRLVNAAAGFALFGGPLLIVDSGTATTVDAISSSGDYLGGAILPGMAVSLEALVARTAKLPRIEMARPQNPIGATTVEAMRSGIYHGYLGQLKELIRVLSDELKGSPKVIATGGLSHWIPDKEVGIHQVLPSLTLEGLRLIYHRNI